jgi:ArsR family transcriptional regulator
LVREGELHVSALCARLKQSQPAVSHHLALLRDAGVIEARREGKHNFYTVRKDRFDRIMAELFTSMTHEGASIRFNDFVVTHDELD